MIYRPIFFFALILMKINGEILFNEETLYPPHWYEAPASIRDFPLINQTDSSPVRLIDPWSYVHRLGLYKILIDVTSPLMPFCSISNASNVLFALPSQFGWLFQSNRLFSDQTMEISPNSWWASANYYLAVIPFLVATEMNLVESDEQFQIVQRENFCSDPTSCFEQVPEMIKEWHQFFLQLKKSKNCIGNHPIDRRIIDQCFLAPLWLAYQTTIDYALPLVESKLNYLPSTVEKDFGLGWARLLCLIARTRKNTNLYETVKNQRQFLPFRMLYENDRPPQSNDLPETVNQSLEILFSFRFDWLSFIEKIWDRITCNYQSRIDAQYSLDNIAVSKFVALHHVARATVHSFLYACDRSV